MGGCRGEVLRGKLCSLQSSNAFFGGEISLLCIPGILGNLLNKSCRFDYYMDYSLVRAHGYISS